MLIHNMGYVNFINNWIKMILFIWIRLGKIIIHQNFVLCSNYNYG